MFQSVVFNEHLLQFYPYETIHIHSNGRGHFDTTTSIRCKVKIFDSLNLSPSPELIKQVCTLYSPDPKITPTTLKVEIRSIQSGYTDCGLFAIAYAVEIADGYDPASIIFYQSKMRNHLHHCLTSKTLTRFPKKQQHHQQTSFTDITSNFPQHLKYESLKTCQTSNR